jgi:RNA polymerase sigma factor (TIGR02999 family)
VPVERRTPRHAPGAVTRLLHRAQGGDETALGELYPLVHDALRAVAVRSLGPHARALWQPTVVVHDAWIKLLKQKRVRWNDRAHFLRVASQVVRNLSIDWARRALARKRGGADVDGSEDPDGLSRPRGPSPDLVLDVAAAVERLAERSPRLARVVELRFFTGLTIPETATALGVSHGTVETEWQLARTLLHEMLQR